jgi:TolB-like protein/lipopolysaccharide biosynthesis regulator YciM
LGQLFQELKRRNVIRVAVAYLISGWLVLQVADLVIDGIGAPDWVMKFLLLLGLLGLPIVLVFSWAYELTPEGVKREKDVDRSESITHDTGRKLNIVTIGMLVAVLAVVAIDRLYFHDQHGPRTPQAAAPVEKSIAVLAFEDLSPAGDQAYFAEGLSEELLNVLAQVGDLQVAGRTSSFAFKGQNKDLREIGELLNVAHILEGSVRRSGDRIRVTAQLIKASDGFHLFSQTYDRELDDVFAVQDEIAQEITNALLSEIVGTEPVATSRTDTEAYELYLLARQRIHTRDIYRMREANNMLERVLDIDPLYAPALAQKALVTYLMSDNIGAYGDIPSAEALPVSMRMVDQALALDDTLAEGYAIKGLLTDSSGRPEDSLEPLEKALAINPTMTNAGNWLGLAYYTLGRRSEARAILEEVVKRDPTYGPAFNNLVFDHIWRREFDAANALIERVTRIVGENVEVLQARANEAAVRGESAKAIRLFRKAIAENPNSSVVQMMYGYALHDVADYETMVAVGVPEHRMYGYAMQGEIDEALREMETMDLAGSFEPRALRYVGMVFNHADRHQEYVDYVLQHYGSLDGLLQKVDLDESWDTGYLPELAYAYRALGNEDSFQRILPLMREAIDVDRAAGGDNYFQDSDEALFFALSGDEEATIAAVETALDAGFGAATFLDSYIFEAFHGNAEFEALRKRLADRVDAERAKLGMPPYRPISSINEERRVFTH